VRPVYHPEFKVSFDRANQHYREIAPALAERFQAEVRTGIGEVLGGLVSHARGPHGLRCYRCKKIPYLIYYQLDGDTALFLAVIYRGREPGFLGDSLSRYTDEAK
jgi:hypothetical protein